MKDSLKKFIDENRNDFDSKQPPEQAWEKIDKELRKQEKQFFLNSINFWRAAAIFLFALSGYLLVSKNYTKPDRQEMAELQGFKDLENYYSLQITEKMDLVQRYQVSTGLNEDDITQNLKKLEAMYLVLKDELKKRPTQDVRDALVLNLLIRIDLINQQLNKLDKPMTGSAEKRVQS